MNALPPIGISGGRASGTAMARLASARPLPPYLPPNFDRRPLSTLTRVRRLHLRPFHAILH